MENIFRVVITGPVGAGKSTFIRTISEIDTIDTDRIATDETALQKLRTTVAMDFGRLSLGDGMSLHLYGTPGQERFDFMWDLLVTGAHGCILLIPAHLPGHIQAARSIKAFMRMRSDCPMVIGITHGDHPDAWPVEDILCVVGNENDTIPCVSLNANQADSVAETLLTLVGQWTQDEGTQEFFYEVDGEDVVALSR